MRKSRHFTHYPHVTFYRRRLPHFHNHNQPVFLTWCLHGSLPPNRVFPRATLTSGEAFAALDRLLDEARTGPFYLKQPAIASLVVAAMYHCADVLGHYTLHAFVVMPNHVHMLVSPQVPVPKLTKTLKTFTARQANQLLGLTGNRSGKKKVTIAWSTISRSSRASTITSKTNQSARVWLESRVSILRQAREPTGKSPADQRSAPLTL